MSAILSSTAAPVYAVKVWSDGTTLFAEVPAGKPGGLPYVVKYPATADGHHQMVRLLATRFEDAPAIARYNAPTQSYKALKGTMSQRERATNILKVMGIIPR